MIVNKRKEKIERVYGIQDQARSALSIRPGFWFTANQMHYDYEVLDALYRRGLLQRSTYKDPARTNPAETDYFSVIERGA